jgi:hypothetical protein
MQDFITVAIFNYPHEIEILKHRLNLEGIPYHFENEAAISVAPMYSIALGGIKLKVHPNDAANVRAIVEELTGGDHLKLV